MFEVRFTNGHIRETNNIPKGEFTLVEFELNMNSNPNESEISNPQVPREWD